MKRLLAIAICFSLLCASAVWAFAGCENFAAAASGHHDDHQSGAHRHGDASAPQHTESGIIHCPNGFGAILVGTPITLVSQRRCVALVDSEVFELTAALQLSNPGRFGLGPPGAHVAGIAPLYLLLSVIRI